MVASIALLYAVSVARDAPLRSSCDTNAAVATIPAGTEVEIRFAVSDGSNCFKIAASVDGKSVTGYVDGSTLTGTNSFDRQRREGASLDGGARAENHPASASFEELAHNRLATQDWVHRVPASCGSADRGLCAQKPVDPVRDPLHVDPQQVEILELLNSHEPGTALERIEAQLKTNARDPHLLALAAVAAYQSDNIGRAVVYCKDALAVSQDGGVVSFCRTVERESKADKSGQKLYGLRVVLRYESESLRADAARSMLAALDQEYIRISDQLGCPAKERITAIVQSRQAYLNTTNAAEWSGGLYDGRIHVSLHDGQELDAGARRTLAHEIVHACLANIGTFPAWLHEGLAQRFSGDTLPEVARRKLRTSIQSGSVPRLEDISQDWSRMSAEHARLAYNLALAAADALLENYANYGLRNVLHNPQMLRQITPGLDKILGL